MLPDLAAQWKAYLCKPHSISLFDMKKIALSLSALFLILLINSAFFLASNSAGPINWMSIEEAAAKGKRKPRKVVIDVYTDWCGWCKKMDKTTFADEKVAKYVNDKYYAVKLDAESKEPITLNGKIYKYNPQAKAHELALELLQGRMSYPTTVYLDEKFNTIQVQPGYLEAPVFNKLVHFFGENAYQNQSWSDFEKSFSQK
jgi:thioredoxin-related protein